MSYVSVHNHSYYSILDGLLEPLQLARWAKGYGMPAVGITDHGTLSGLVEHHLACQTVGIKPILGVEAYMVDDHRQHVDMKSPTGKTIRSGYHIVLLAQNLEGYRNLIRLNNVAFNEGFYRYPRIDWQLLQQYNKGLIVTSACLGGHVGQYALGSGDPRPFAGRFKDIFKERYFLEVMDNYMQSDAQRTVNKRVLGMAKSMDIPVIPTNDAHYLTEDQVDMQAVVLCMQTKKTLKDPNRLTYDGVYHLKPPQEMQKLFGDHMKNTLVLAEMVEPFNIFSEQMHVPLHLQDPNATLRTMAQVNALTMNLTQPAYQERLEHELKIIQQLNLASYLLVTANIMKIIKDTKCPVGWGRGSGVGSLVCHVLGITGVDPLKHNLLFERFINEHRPDWPDIDIDIAMSKRDEVIQAIMQQYGHDQVAHITTYSTLMPKALIRDICRVMGKDNDTADNLSRLVPARADSFEGLEKSETFMTTLNQTQEGQFMLRVLRHVLGAPRHAGMHASGLVISSQSLFDDLPIRNQESRFIVQYPMSCYIDQESHAVLEKLGFLKFDVLGLNKLDIVFDTAKEVGVEIHEIPLDDAKTFELIGEGNVQGIFQLDASPIAEDLCKQIRPRSIDELALILALNRPGVIDAGLHEEYVKRRNGTHPTTYVHPDLAGVLEHHGICVYQEDMMQMARVFAGFTLAEAEILRRGIGKKDENIINQSKETFRKKAQDLKRDPADIERVLEQITASARYSFNKCLAHDTQIATPQGFVALRNIRPGQAVYSVNQRNQVVEQRVVANHSNGVQEVFEVGLSNGTKIEATHTHQLLTNQGYKTVAQLTVGDVLKACSQLTPSFSINQGFNDGVTRPTHGHQIPGEMVADNTQRNDVMHAQSVLIFSAMNAVRHIANATTKLVALQSNRLGIAPRPINAVGSLVNATISPILCTARFLFGQLGALHRRTQHAKTADVVLDGGRIHSKFTGNGWATHFMHQVKACGMFQQRWGHDVISLAMQSHGFQSVEQGFSAALQTQCLSNISVAPSCLNHLCNTFTMFQKPLTFLTATFLKLWSDFCIINRTRVRPLLQSNLSKLATHNSIHSIYNINETHVVSIKNVGSKLTYDLEMPQHHNYIANGVVSHNSHAVAYAYLSYACAYLSAHYPLAFFKNLIKWADKTHQPRYLSAALIRNISILPPSVNTAPKEISIEGNALRLGLCSIKGIKDATAQRIMDRRPFDNMAAVQAKLSTTMVTTLYWAGGLADIPDVHSFHPINRIEQDALLGINLTNMTTQYKDIIDSYQIQPVHTIGERGVCLVKTLNVREITDKNRRLMAFLPALDIFGPYVSPDLVMFARAYNNPENAKPAQNQVYLALLERLSRGGFHVVRLQTIDQTRQRMQELATATT